MDTKPDAVSASWAATYRRDCPSRPVVDVLALEKRIRAYRAIGYEIEDAATPSTPAEYVIEYDERV
jgi:hypothetical protein